MAPWPPRQRRAARLVRLNFAMETWLGTGLTHSARIGLDYKTKTVTGGALSYEEFLPPETLMYSVVIANEGRRANARVESSASEILKFVTDKIPPNSILQIGANETIGKGLCAISLASSTAPAFAELRS